MSGTLARLLVIGFALPTDDMSDSRRFPRPDPLAIPPKASPSATSSGQARL